MSIGNGAPAWPSVIVSNGRISRSEHTVRPLVEARGIAVVVLTVDKTTRSSGGTARYSKPLLERNWHASGGTLLDRVQLVPQSPTHDRQRAHGIIVRDGERRHLHESILLVQMLDGVDVIVVGTATGSFGMYVLGEVLFAADLIHRLYTPASVRKVVVCEVSDLILQPLAERHGIEFSVL